MVAAHAVDDSLTRHERHRVHGPTGNLVVIGKGGGLHRWDLAAQFGVHPGQHQRRLLAADQVVRPELPAAALHDAQSVGLEHHGVVGIGEGILAGGGGGITAHGLVQLHRDGGELGTGDVHREIIPQAVRHKALDRRAVHLLPGPVADFGVNSDSKVESCGFFR